MLSKKITFNFSAEKNTLLIQERNIGFEEIIAAIDNGNLLTTVEHPNKEKFAHQKMYVVYANSYVYLVPFIEEAGGEIFLKTIIPSRKAKKLYLNSDEETENGRKEKN